MIGVDDIDDMVAAPKEIAGRPQWDKSRDTTVRLKAPLWIGEEIVGGLFLIATASVVATPQHGSLVLVFQDQPIQRLDAFPSAPHANPFKNVPKELRGLTLPSGDHQFHTWQHNRRWPRPPKDNLPIAAPIDPPLVDYRAAIDFFLTRTNIHGMIPLPPHEPRLSV
ncbi:MAG: hypothetical protein EA405_13380 [Rhodospirillales bacterium]|nr:MAG: hypothetical protein EA405_13380 [Rhodospirillales bacterium]